MPSEEEVPAGPHRQLLAALHQAYAEAGRPGLRQISTGLKNDNSAPGTVNYQAIGKILNGKQLPNPRQLVSLALWLIREGEIRSEESQDPKEYIQRLLTLRDAAHDNALGITAKNEDLNNQESKKENIASSDTLKLILEAESHIEQSLLSCMLQSSETIADIVEPITPDSFSSALNREIYGALLELYADSQDISCEKVAEKVTSTEINVPEYLTSLQAMDVDLSDATNYADLAIRIAKVKRVALLGGAFTDLAGRALGSEQIADIDSLVDSVTDEVFSFLEEIHRISRFTTVLESALDEAEGIGRRHPRQAIPSGLAELDALISGFQPGEFIIVGGAPGIGKSTLAIDFARSISLRHARTSLLVSLQMSQQEMAMRIMSAEGRVALHRMRSTTMEDEDWERLVKVMPSISQAPIYMKDDPLYTFQELVASCEWLSSFKHLQCVLIDSIDIMDFESQNSPAEYERDLTFMARELRKLAKRLDISIVALFQTERPAHRYPVQRPDLHDVPRPLEKYADTVILLHREDAYDRESPRAGEADLIVGKNRTGPVGVATVAFQGHYARFVSMTGAL
ncbi:replicative DNA helicase [Streptomyces arenae]|uniref:replicative DNA helicase n=1 Tax=Streptomyces arenae TaxID=29301 RepID=UPI00265B53A5|nr:DnaB-like helicase C-terminal domain-containing protein [Streptomyces arenae]MCG7204134.1 replicative DNA helicase [Streptomyces arenae]